MSSIQVRRFARSDWDQVTRLVNAHIGAVVPNVSVSVHGLMSQLEGEPDEFIVDPWVTDRLTLVAEQRNRVVAAAHLLCYGTDERVSASYRDAGEVRWLVCWPDAPYWPDSAEAGAVLARACVRQLQRWGVSRCYADGSLPVPGVYGVPEQWPHVRDIYQRVGFRPDGHTELVFVARIADLPGTSRPPIPGLTSRRSLGVNGTRISAILDADVIGYIEITARLSLGWEETLTPRLHVGEKLGPPASGCSVQVIRLVVNRVTSARHGLSS